MTKKRALERRPAPTAEADKTYVVDYDRILKGLGVEPETVRLGRELFSALKDLSSSDEPKGRPAGLLGPAPDEIFESSSSRPAEILEPERLNRLRECVAAQFARQGDPDPWASVERVEKGLLRPSRIPPRRKGGDD
jgi:hypothetical protein